MSFALDAKSCAVAALPERGFCGLDPRSGQRGLSRTSFSPGSEGLIQQIAAGNFLAVVDVAEVRKRRGRDAQADRVDGAVGEDAEEDAGMNRAEAEVGDSFAVDR